MIPTMIAVGFVIGRWWAVPVGGIGWMVAILVWGDPGPASVWYELAGGAFLFGLINTAAGVAVHRAAAALFRRARRAVGRPTRGTA